MLSTTVVHVCPRCRSEKIRKNGHADNGAQRARCPECGRTFILQPKGARYDGKFKDQVVAAYQDRMSHQRRRVIVARGTRNFCVPGGPITTNVGCNPFDLKSR